MSPQGPEPTLRNLTGRGIKIAVIDSGVYPKHPHIGPIAGGIAVLQSGNIVSGDYLDRLGHGTAVTAAIQEKAPEAEYYAVRVFHSSLSTSASCLVRAIDWCIDQKMDVVNLSLGSVNPAHRESFAQAALRATGAGCLLVAARESDGQLCYPGCLPTVISVGLDLECSRETFRFETIDGQDVFYASGYPRPVPGVPPSRNLKGISFAVANMSSFVVRACHAASTFSDSSEKANVVRHLLQAASSS